MSESLLIEILDSLRARTDVVAAWLAGSRGRRTNDAFSDIDIWVAIDEDSMPAIVADPLSFVHEVTPTIMHVIAPEIAPPGGAFVGSWVAVGDAFCQVDWYLTPCSGATRAPETLMVLGEVPVAELAAPAPLSNDQRREKVIDNLVLALQMINNMVKHARRNSTWRALEHARHADSFLVIASHMHMTSSAPGFVARSQTLLPELARPDERGLQQIATHLTDRVERLTVYADVAALFAAPIAAMRATIMKWGGMSEAALATASGLKLLPEAEYYASLPRRRVAAGQLLTNPAGEILLVETTYKPEWEIPGGICDAGESPRMAARREAREEIGIDREPGDLLVIDHVAHPAPKGDMLIFVYDGGVISDPDEIIVDHVEIAAVHFVSPDQLAVPTKPAMTRRLLAAVQARGLARPIEIGSDLPGMQQTSASL